MTNSFSFRNISLFSIAAALLLQRNSLTPATRLSVSSLGCLIFLPLCVARILWIAYIYPHYLSPLRHLPRPPDKPSLFMGHSPFTLRTSPGDALRRWNNCIPNQGIIRYLDFFNLERLAIVSPAALAEVLNQRCYDFEKPPQLRKGISRILGMGLFLAEGDVHKRQRKNLMPAFAYRHVKNLYPMFWDKSSEMVTALAALLDNTDEVDPGAPSSDTSIEVNEWASRAALDIIGKGGFGQSFNAIQDPGNELSRIYRDLSRPGRTGQILGFLGFLLPQWLVRQLPFLRNSKMKHASDLIRDFCLSSIQSKREKSVTSTQPELDILSVAMGSGGFSDQELVDQMMTFLAAGHETTVSAVTWAVYVIAKHPEIQDRLRDELDGTLPNPLSDSPSSITAEMIEKLPYLSAVCREVLRLYSPVALTIRVAVRDTSIAGQHIPEGTTVMIPPWAVNASTELWGEDAQEFKPERWQQGSSNTSDNKGTNYNYLTFLHGPRSCIGQTFAVGEMTCLLAAWVAAFDTRLADQDYVPEIRGGITAKPKDGLHVRLKPRTTR